MTQAYERALVVTAHPDDVDFGAAGTVASLVAAGPAVTYCVVTSGDAGGVDPAVPRSQIPRIRQEEQRAAGAVVGVTDVRFLGYIDGELTVTHDLRRDLSRVIRQVRPNLMIIQSPDRNWDRIPASHPDHLATGEASMYAIYPDARNQFAHVSLYNDEGLQAWTVPEVWVMGAPNVDFYVDVTDFFDQKIGALKAHLSQTAHHEDLSGFIRGWLTGAAAAGGLPEGRLAEGFKRVLIP